MLQSHSATKAKRRLDSSTKRGILSYRLDNRRKIKLADEQKGRDQNVEHGAQKRLNLHYKFGF